MAVAIGTDATARAVDVTTDGALIGTLLMSAIHAATATLAAMLQRRTPLRRRRPAFRTEPLALDVATDGALRRAWLTFAVHASTATLAALLQRCNTLGCQVLDRRAEKSDVIELPDDSGPGRTACGVADTGHMASTNSTTE
jgi:hypothetical protein